jgi:hypothetical protein
MMQAVRSNYVFWFIRLSCGSHDTNTVIPAKAGIHTMCHMALCYGFPLSRE